MAYRQYPRHAVVEALGGEENGSCNDHLASLQKMPLYEYCIAYDVLRMTYCVSGAGGPGLEDEFL